MQILRSSPDHPDANHLLGMLTHQTGRQETGLNLIRKAISIKPDFAGFHLSLGNALLEEGRLDEAAESYRKCLNLRPDYARAHMNLGTVYDSLGRLDQAIACCRKAIEVDPKFAEAYYNLGNALIKKEQFDEAILYLKKAIAFKPDFYEAYYNLGIALNKQEKPDEALEMFNKAVAINADYDAGHFNRGNFYLKTGEHEKAIACYRQALAANRQRNDVHMTLLFTMNLCANISQPEIYQEACEWARRHASGFAGPRTDYKNSKQPFRRLRIGYVSPDLRSHSVAYFMVPVLEAHDRSQVEIFCYYTASVSDEISRQCASLTDHWRQCDKMSDDALAERISTDQIDILVDLAGHTEGNRLLVFARKPAPIQVSYLGYIATTGLTAIDYRLTNIDANPPGSEDYYTEELYRFTDHLWWCYRPQPGMPEVRPSPVLVNNFITFGYTNNYSKVTEELIEIFVEILKRIPGSKLVMAAMPKGSLRSAFLAKFTDNGIDKQRLIMHGGMSLDAFWDLHHSIDIVLDPFPYNGGTTTCDDLWLGVPVVTMVGEAFVSRMGYAILKNIGLPDLVAATREEYVNIATGLADNIEELNDLRLSMRERMASSSICDVSGFTRELEAAYRWMWRKWCR